MNKKTKFEQLFIILIACIGVFGLFAISGCGGEKSCELPRFGSDDSMGINATGVSIPGCGGCLSSGKGCNSCLWPQSCKFSHGEVIQGTNNEGGGGKTKDKASLTGCDIRYYGGGCLDCGQREKKCFSGYIDVDDSDDGMKGFFFGSSDDEEKIIGCANGCGGCVADGNMGENLLNILEKLEGIN